MTPQKPSISGTEFDTSYDKLILSGNFHEIDDYYVIHKPRYKKTLNIILSEANSQPRSCLEIGGGQISLLLNDLLGTESAIADVNASFYPYLKEFNIPFFEFDLLHDESISTDQTFDLIVLCEVIEHIPIPAHIVFEKVIKCLNPGGHLFLTTPNLYRFRNCVRMLSGGHLFCDFRYPAKGSGMGHFIEYSKEHMQWQLEEAGLIEAKVKRMQLHWEGSSAFATYARYALSPLFLLNPRWRDSLVAWAKKPD